MTAKTPKKTRARREKAEDVVVTVSEVERKPDFLWNGRPVYRCQFCGKYERVDNLPAVLRHESGHQAPVRASPILGADGEPLLIKETRNV